MAGEIQVPCGDLLLAGEWLMPAAATGVVLFAHGSGSSRHSPRNQSVARMLRSAGMGTLLFDLLTASEEEEDRFTGHLRFDIDLLAQRLIAAAEWVHAQEPELRLGYFGASTGGGAALLANARSNLWIRAIVSRGGRPDLAGAALPQVKAATLLIVGGNDTAVIELNRQAYERLRCEKEMQLIPGATHLFEENGALERVAQMAAKWLGRHLAA
ncbi:MAG: alpha/beta hydrolase [Verrucomicrobiota bacterium]